MKKDIDFDNLDFAKDSDSDGYILDESNNKFELYLNGYYNDCHSVISIEELELKLDNSKDNDYSL